MDTTLFVLHPFLSRRECIWRGHAGVGRRKIKGSTIDSKSVICDRAQLEKLVEHVLGILGINIVLGHHQEASVDISRDGFLVKSDVIGVLDSHVAHVE